MNLGLTFSVLFLCVHILTPEGNFTLFYIKCQISIVKSVFQILVSVSLLLHVLVNVIIFVHPFIVLKLL